MATIRRIRKNNQKLSQCCLQAIDDNNIKAIEILLEKTSISDINDFIKYAYNKNRPQILSKLLSVSKDFKNNNLVHKSIQKSNYDMIPILLPYYSGKNANRLLSLLISKINKFKALSDFTTNDKINKLIKIILEDEKFTLTVNDDLLNIIGYLITKSDYSDYLNAIFDKKGISPSFNDNYVFRKAISNKNISLIEFLLKNEDIDPNILVLRDDIHLAHKFTDMTWKLLCQHPKFNPNNYSAFNPLIHSCNQRNLKLLMVILENSQTNLSINNYLAFKISNESKFDAGLYLLCYDKRFRSSIDTLKLLLATKYTYQYKCYLSRMPGEMVDRIVRNMILTYPQHIINILGKVLPIYK